MLYVDDYLQFHPHCGERWVSGAHTLLCFSVHHIQAPKPPLNEPLKKGKYKIMTVHHLVNKLELLTEHNNANNATVARLATALSLWEMLTMLPSCLN